MASVAAFLAVLDVLSFGARGDGRSNDAPFIQAALNHAAALTASGGGQVRVLLPRDRVFVSGPLFLQSNVDFHISTNTTLQGSLNFQDYPFAWQLWGYSRLSLLNGAACVANSSSTCTQYGTLSNVTVSGDDWTSVIDGQGHSWWYATNFWPDGASLGRNPMLELEFITNLTVRDIKLTRSPSWTLHPWMCTDVLVDNVYVDSGTWYSSWPYEGFNVDGIEPDNSVNVVIQNSVVHAGDDCIAIDTSFQGNAYYAPLVTHNVLVRNVTCRTPISIGGRTTLGVYDVLITNCTVDASGAPADPYGLWRPKWYTIATRIKSKDTEGAAGVHNVTYRDLVVHNVDAVANYMIYYDCFNSSGVENQRYCETLEAHNNASAVPVLRDIRYEGVTGSAWRAAWLVCSPLAPCYNISFTNVSLTPLSSGEGPFGYACDNVASVIDGGGNVPAVTGCAPAGHTLRALADAWE